MSIVRFYWFSSVIGAPFSDSGFQITDEAVPFYQMVLHGLVNMAGEPVNLAPQDGTALLGAAETGSTLLYQWGYAPSDVMKNTDYSGLYALHYQDSFDDAIQNYKRLNTALRSLQDVFIVSHARLADDVFQTVYEDGTTVLVNYGDEDYTQGNVRVAAGNFEVLPKEGLQ